MEVTQFSHLYNQPSYGYVPIDMFNRREYVPHIELPKNIVLNISSTKLRRTVTRLVQLTLFNQDKNVVFFEEIKSLQVWAELQHKEHGEQRYIEEEVTKFNNLLNKINNNINDIDSIRSIFSIDSEYLNYITGTITDDAKKTEFMGRKYSPIDERYWNNDIAPANLSFARDLTKNINNFLLTHRKVQEIEYFGVRISNNARLLNSALIDMLSEDTLIEVSLGVGKKPARTQVLKALLKAMMLKSGKYALGRDVLDRVNGDSIEHPLHLPNLKYLHIFVPRHSIMYDINLDDIKPVTDYITSRLFNLDINEVTDKILWEMEEEIKVFYEVDKKGNLIK